KDKEKNSFFNFKRKVKELKKPLLEEGEKTEENDSRLVRPIFIYALFFTSIGVSKILGSTDIEPKYQYVLENLLGFGIGVLISLLFIYTIIYTLIITTEVFLELFNNECDRELKDNQYQNSGS